MHLQGQVYSRFFFSIWSVSSIASVFGQSGGYGWGFIRETSERSGYTIITLWVSGCQMSRTGANLGENKIPSGGKV